MPAATLPPLDPGEMVTHGDPGWWVIDQLTVSRGPLTDPSGRPDCYALVPWIEWGAARSRAQTGVEVTHIFRSTEQLWVYRDQPEIDDVDQLPDAPHWLARVGDGSTPPPVRRPRPARELPSLTGTRLRVQDDAGTWHWVVALGEPTNDQDDITVPVTTLRGYGELIYGGRHVRSHTPPLHRLWTY